MAVINTRQGFLSVCFSYQHFCTWSIPQEKQANKWLCFKELSLKLNKFICFQISHFLSINKTCVIFSLWDQSYHCLKTSSFKSTKIQAIALRVLAPMNLNENGSTRIPSAGNNTITVKGPSVVTYISTQIRVKYLQSKGDTELKGNSRDSTKFLR